MEHVFKNFTDRESGHRLLLEYIRDHKTDQVNLNLVEVGCTRERMLTNNSTFKLATLAEEYDYHFWTIDVDSESINTISHDLNEENPKIHLVNRKAEDYLVEFDKSIDYLYLDGFDFTTGPNHHNKTRQDKYLKYLGCQIENELCYQMHLDVVKVADKNIPVGGIICINNVLNLDDYKYKGFKAVPWLIETGKYQILKQDYGAILLKKIKQTSEKKTTNEDAEKTTNKDAEKKTTNENDQTSNKNVDQEDEKITLESNQKSESNPYQRTNTESNLKESNDNHTELKDQSTELKEEDKNQYVVTLMGYSKPGHTNWFPWNRFYDVFGAEGFRRDWKELEDFKNRSKDDPRRIFICWNQPTCIELIKYDCLRPDDIIIQKLTSLGKGMNHVNWGDNPKEFCQSWNWPLYLTVEKLFDQGFNIYGFGCQTIYEPFPEKARIVKKLQDAGRLFWINWGSTMFSKKEIEECQPIIKSKDEYQYDVGFVGSLWGRPGRGNIHQMDQFLFPIVKNVDRRGLFGSGLSKGQISDNEAKKVLKDSALCPIIHAPSWIAEEGIQDRFYSVFTAGRFGVCDNPGVYQFFDKDEVVVETDPEKFVERSIWFMNHPEEQRSYIEKVQAKLKTKYNFYIQWNHIISSIIKSNPPTNSNQDNEFNQRVEEVKKLEGSFYHK